MSKKQTYPFNLFLFFWFGLFIIPNPAKAQSIEQQLIQADSLFKQKKYTESFEIYEQIFVNEQYATPQMLMKMAYIKEGLGNQSEALLYLNHYYQKTSDKRARDKMSDLAEEYELKGYDRTDTTFFIGIYNQFYLEITASILSVACLLIALAAYRKFKKKDGFLPLAGSAMGLLVLYLVFVNYSGQNRQAIITDNYAYLMSGPSSGSDLVDVVKKGHRVIVLDQNDIWIKIEWNGSPAYIRKNKLKLTG